jgi:MFS family permease
MPHRATRFLASLYGFCFLSELMLIYPFYAIMFVDHGLSPMEISILFAVWSATVIVLEVPSGVLADKYARKWILFFGQLIRAVGYVCWALFPEFWGFLIGFILWGIEGPLSSGAFEALVYDELKQVGREAGFVRTIGRTRSFRLIGMIVSSVAASWVVSYGYDLLLVASTIAVLGAGALLLSLPTAKPAESTADRPYLMLLRNGIRYALREPVILRLIIFIALAIALAGTLGEYWTIFAVEAEIPKFALGFFLALLYSIQALASATAHCFEDLPARIFFAAFFACGLILLGAAWLMRPASVFLLLVFSFVFQVIDIVFEGKLQHAIPDETRATVSSVKGFSTEVAGILLFLSMGGIVGPGPYRIGFLIFGVVTGVVGLVYWLLRSSFSSAR